MLLCDATPNIVNPLQPWSQLGAQIAETTASIANAEKEIFHTLRDEVCFQRVSVTCALKFQICR